MSESIWRRQPSSRLGQDFATWRWSVAGEAVAEDFFEPPVDQGDTAICAWGASANWGVGANVATNGAVVWALAHGRTLAASLSITGSGIWSAAHGRTLVGSIAIGCTATWSAPASWIGDCSVSVASAAAWNGQGAWAGQGAIAITVALAWSAPSVWGMAGEVVDKPVEPILGDVEWASVGAWGGAGSVAVSAATLAAWSAGWSVATSVGTGGTLAVSWPACWSAKGQALFTCTAIWGSDADWSTTASISDTLPARTAWYGEPVGWQKGRVLLRCEFLYSEGRRRGRPVDPSDVRFYLQYPAGSLQIITPARLSTGCYEVTICTTAKTPGMYAYCWQGGGSSQFAKSGRFYLSLST